MWRESVEYKGTLIMNKFYEAQPYTKGGGE